jgi:transcriptional regulator with XRE-family HTH domain
MGMIDTDKVRRLREKLKLTQAQAAEAAGLGGRQGWCDLEAGRRDNIELDTLRRIAETLGVRAKDLLK